MGIALAAILLFVGTAGAAVPAIMRAWTGAGSAPDTILTTTLLLNIALILLGWHRYRQINEELNQSRHSEEEARKIADQDHLTGCANRRNFVRSLDVELDERCEAERAYAIIVVDLDNFKQINDLNGHAAGDQVLLATARRIARVLPSEAMLARLGGDEFVCYMPYYPAAPQHVEAAVARMIDEVSRPLTYHDQTIEVTISIGMASSLNLDGLLDDSTPAQELMHKADIAMYHAKKQGKNGFYWFESSMENELRYRNELEAGIRRGVREGEFVPFYEQQIDLQTGELVGFEMLARWNSPELGLVGPDVFIPIAEEIGAIGELSEALIAQAFVDAKEWDPKLTLSVNISPVQMRDPWFAQKILKLLVKHRFPPDRLEIELTESCLLESTGLARSMITSLRNQGVNVSLDDFGTGYSSLSQLRSLPFDRLKIDRSFIAELREEAHGARLVDAIIAMSDGLELPITAEGIENDEVLELLKRMGSMKGQGYHYGRPEPANLVRERLSAAGRLKPAERANVIALDALGPLGGPGKRAG